MSSKPTIGVRTSKQKGKVVLDNSFTDSSWGGSDDESLKSKAKKYQKTPIMEVPGDDSSKVNLTPKRTSPDRSASVKLGDSDQ
jgi:hypothetical protein